MTLHKNINLVSPFLLNRAISNIESSSTVFIDDLFRKNSYHNLNPYKPHIPKKQKQY